MIGKTCVFYRVILLFAVVLTSCKKSYQVAPAESQEIKSLKQFYAGSAKVDIAKVSYNEARDEFSINGDAIIPHYKLSILQDAIIERGRSRNERDTITLQ